MEAEGKNPDVVMACVGGGSNSIGMFADFIDEPEVELIGVEAAALELRPENMPAPWLWESPSIAWHAFVSVAGYRWKYPAGTLYFRRTGLSGSRMEHAYLRDTGRAKYVAITDVEAMDALMELCKLEELFRQLRVHMPLPMHLKRQKK